MKKLLLVLVLLITMFYPSLILAQNSTTGTNDNTVTQTQDPTFEYFTVKVYTEGQSAWDKSVPIFVQFIATIDSDKVQIDWDAPSSVTVIPKYKQFFSVKAGETYTLKALIKPKIAGTYNIAANVIAWQYNTNYTSSGNTVIKFSENLLTDPVSSEYSLGIAIKWVVLVLSIGVSAYLGYIYFVKSKKKFDKWFNLPD